MDAAPTVGEVEQAPPDNQRADALDVLAQVLVIRRLEPELDLRVRARELLLARVVPGEEMFEACLTRPSDVPVERDARTGEDLAHRNRLVQCPASMSRASEPARRPSERPSNQRPCISARSRCSIRVNPSRRSSRSNASGSNDAVHGSPAAATRPARRSYA